MRKNAAMHTSAVNAMVQK
jgi:hypothetical protein